MSTSSSTPPFARLIFFNDLRALLWPLPALASFLALMILFNIETHANGALNVTHQFLLVVFTVFIVLRVFRNDPPGRALHFLSTRPVPGVAICQGKLTFVAVFVVIPYCVVTELMVADSHVSLPLGDHVLLLIDYLLTDGTFIVSMILLAAFMGRVSGLAVSIICLLVQIPFIQWWLLTPYNLASHWLETDKARVMLFDGLCSHAIYIAAALAALAWSYRAKKFWQPLVLVLGGCALSLAVFLWPYDLAQPLHDHARSPALMTAAQLSQIRMTMIQGPHDAKPYNLFGLSDESGPCVILGRSVRIDGIDDHTFVETVGYHAVVTLRSGKSFVSNYSDFHSHGGVGGLAGNPMAQLFSIGAIPPDEKNLYLDLLAYRLGGISDSDLTDATVRGVITFDVRRAFIAGRIPMQQGAVFTFGRRRYEMESVTTSPGNHFYYQMKLTRIPLVLRGDLNGRNTSDDLRWIPVIDSGETLWPQGNGLNGWTSGPVAQSSATGLFRWSDKIEMPSYHPPPPDWISHIQQVFVGSNYCGRITLPYEIDHVDLHYGF